MQKNYYIVYNCTLMSGYICRRKEPVVNDCFCALICLNKYPAFRFHTRFAKRVFLLSKSPGLKQNAFWLAGLTNCAEHSGGTSMNCYVGFNFFKLLNYFNGIIVAMVCKLSNIRMHWIVFNPYTPFRFFREKFSGSYYFSFHIPGCSIIKPVAFNGARSGFQADT